MTDSLNNTDVEQVARLIESLDNSTFDFLELQVGELKVTIGKGEPPAQAAAVAPVAAQPAPQVLPAAPVAAPVAAAPVAAAPVTAAPVGAAPAMAPAVVAAPPAAAPAGTATAGSIEITAPTMGIFYAQSEPGKPPFVTVGALVEESTTVALVEVMKTFHAVPAGIRGTVVEVCVQDAELVEFGQVLYRVEPVVG